MHQKDTSQPQAMKSPVKSLAANYYTDPEIFIAEKQGVLANSWQFACHSTQLKLPGDYLCFDIAGENLFCILDHEGKIKTFYNVCQHRAHELVKGSGQVKGKLLVCPYHAWSYSLSGKFVTGPNVNSVTGFDKRDICLTEISTELFCGFVFVNLNPEAKPMEHWYPGVRAELSAFVPDIDRLEPVEWVEVTENCNWKVSVENYSECYHCQLNHPAFATGIVKPETYDIQPRGFCLRHTTECQSLDDMSYPIDVNANQHAGEYSSWFFWPGFSFQVYPGNVLNTYHWRPIDVDIVKVVRGWFTPEGQPSDVIKQLAIQDLETTVKEDIHLVESVSRGLKSRGYRPGPLVVDPAGGVSSEHSIAALQRWMREGLMDPSDKNQKLEL